MSTRERQDAKRFERVVFITRDDLLGARWWHEGMAASVARRTPDRRTALKLLFAMGGVGGAMFLLRGGCDDGDAPAVTMDALELQRREGWAVGAQGHSLVFADALAVDSAGATDWQTRLAILPKDLAPGDARLDPYYVSTLLDVFGNPRGAGLTTVVRPMRSAAMQAAEAAARALASLFADPADRNRSALILDMPGPLAVAAAAGVCRSFIPVFLFDNWPHPLGVVASHYTLAAAIYHRPDFLAARADRPAGLPPAFVLDSERLAPYRDDSNRFDNRYLARVPSADGLRALGIERVLYVTAAPARNELDDLNDDFVGWKRRDIDVKMVALSDFAPAPRELLAAQRLPSNDRTYYYGGHPLGHAFFWSSYGWHSPRYAGSAGAAALPRPVSPGHRFAPVSRPTIFSSRTIGGAADIGKQRPSGFGRVSYRSSGGSSSFGRSGSFGRSRFSGSG